MAHTWFHSINPQITLNSHKLSVCWLWHYCIMHAPDTHQWGSLVTSRGNYKGPSSTVQMNRCTASVALAPCIRQLEGAHQKELKFRNTPIRQLTAQRARQMQLLAATQACELGVGPHHQRGKAGKQPRARPMEQRGRVWRCVTFFRNKPGKHVKSCPVTFTPSTALLTAPARPPGTSRCSFTSQPFIHMPRSALSYNTSSGLLGAPAMFCPASVTQQRACQQEGHRNMWIKTQALNSFLQRSLRMLTCSLISSLVLCAITATTAATIWAGWVMLLRR